MRNFITIILIAVLFSFCQTETESTYSRASEMIDFCNAIGISTQESTKVLYVPHSKCSACQLSSDVITKDTTSLIYVVHFNGWKGKLDDDRFVYKSFGDISPMDFGIITPYPVLFEINKNKIQKFEAALNTRKSKKSEL